MYRFTTFAKKNPMKLRVLLTIFAISVTIVAFIVEIPDNRLAVKTLTDKEATNINWTPKETTIPAISKFVQPFPGRDKKFDKNIRFWYEFNVYEIKCRIREFRKDDQGDYHLVLMDINDSTSTIVGQILNPESPALVGSQYMGSFTNTREEFELFMLPRNKVMEGVYTITGVCFFDQHHEVGSAPNLVEIHPIMDIITNFK